LRFAQEAKAEQASSPRVRISTSWSTPLINQGDTIVNIIEVHDGIAGLKVRIQNSNHGANRFKTDFATAVKLAIAAVPGVSFTQVNASQFEITLVAGTYVIPISQTVTSENIPETIDDAPWAPGKQLQVDWILSSAPSNGAPVESGHAVDSKWITYQTSASIASQQGGAPAPQPSPSDARWSLLRSVSNIGASDKVTFELDLTNHVLTSPATIRLSVDAASTAADSDFVDGLHKSIANALQSDINYDQQTGNLTFGPKAVFPFKFTMMAGSIWANEDYVLKISDNQIGEIDVPRAGVRLGTLSMPPMSAMIGVNQASGEFGIGALNFKYAYPGKDRIGWTAAQGFGIIRVPFLFQNIQARSSAKLNEAAMRPLDQVMNDCAALHVICLLEMHNYGAYYLDESTSTGLPGQIGTSNSRLADLWSQIAIRYKDNSFVWFDLMNEPNKQSALEWVKSSNAIAAAIRATGATNKIVFQGTAWDGAWTWASSGNAEHMLKAYDPGNNFAFEAHQYLDGDGSGTSPTCVLGSGSTRLDPFTTWLRKYGLQGIIGEVGWAANEVCTIEAKALLNHWRAATTSSGGGGYIGLTYWANGPWWPDSYMYLGEPRPFPNGPEPVQLRTLKEFVPR
jgi:endoglucanase